MIRACLLNKYPSIYILQAYYTSVMSYTGLQPLKGTGKNEKCYLPQICA